MTNANPGPALLHLFAPLRRVDRAAASAPMPTALPRRQLRRFEPGTVRRLHCVSGALWVTIDGDPVDHVLQAGESIEATGRDVLIAYALQPSVLSTSCAKPAFSS